MVVGTASGPKVPDDTTDSHREGWEGPAEGPPRPRSGLHGPFTRSTRSYAPHPHPPTPPPDRYRVGNR